MTDSVNLAAWRPKFEDWTQFAKPLIREGKGKEAFTQYPWFTTEGEPFTRLEKPASQTRFGLITTGGYSIDGEQEPMDGRPNFRGEAPQIRRIPLSVDRTKLVIHHRGYDHRFAKEDYNANLPLDRLRELVTDGVIGSVAEETVVLMGLQPDVAPLLQVTIPEIIAAFQLDGVEAALLVPS